MQRPNLMKSSSTQNRKLIREKTDSNIASIYGMPPPTNNNTASRLAQIDDMKYFFATATQQWNHNKALKRFDLTGGESISCVLWDGLFFITGTDIVRSLTFRFHAFGRPVTNAKKFEEGIFSDLRNLKPGQDARLENPKSELLEMLYKSNCIRTQKKQKVFFWFSVPHDRLFLDALERDLKREKMGLEPTTRAVAQPATSITLEAAQDLFNQLKRSKSKPIPKTDHSSSLRVTSPTPSLFKLKNDDAQLKRPRVNSVPSLIGQKQQLELFQQKQRQSHGSYFSTSPLPSLTTGRIRTNMSSSSSMLSSPDTVSLSDISKHSISSPLHSSDFVDLSNGVHHLDITSSLSNTSSTSSILQHDVPPSQSVDGRVNKTIIGNLSLFDAPAAYKSRRRRASSVSTSLLNSPQFGGGPERIRRHEKCNIMRMPSSSSNMITSAGLINSQSSRLAMAAAKAGFTPVVQPPMLLPNQSNDWQDFYCPIPDCQHLFKKAEHLERHMHALHSYTCTVCGKGFYQPDALAQHHRMHKEDVLNHQSPQHSDGGSSRCSTLSPMLDVDFEMADIQPRPFVEVKKKNMEDDISSSSASSPHSVFRYQEQQQMNQTMKLLDSFKPSDEHEEQSQQQEYTLQPMNDISFDQPSQGSLDLNMDTNMLNETYQSIYAPYVDQQYAPYNYMM